MTLKYKLNLDSIDTQKLRLLLSHYCHTNFSKEEAKDKIKHLHSLIPNEDKITKDNPVYNFFIEWYLSFFDSKVVEIIDIYGIYSRNKETINIFLNESLNEPNTLMEMNVGINGSKVSTDLIIKYIEDCFKYLDTFYISHTKL